MVKRLGGSLLVLLLVVAAFLYLSGYRFSPIAAAKAEFDVGAYAVPFGAVQYPWGEVLLVRTPAGPRTVLLTKHGFLWRAPGDTHFDKSTGRIKTIGWMSYSGSQGATTVFAVETSDPRIASISAGPASARQKKKVDVNTPVIFSWNKAFYWYELNPVALSAEGKPLYKWGVPLNVSAFTPRDLKWYRANGSG
ncbi:MAG: hypothetical protein K6V97_11065 [Actinomycetia bacterium]|nr:hypothetical protein [Actinomycetes bacterium]